MGNIENINTPVGAGLVVYAALAGWLAYSYQDSQSLWWQIAVPLLVASAIVAGDFGVVFLLGS